jgi:hypothetical protein
MTESLENSSPPPVQWLGCMVQDPGKAYQASPPTNSAWAGDRIRGRQESPGQLAASAGDLELSNLLLRMDRPDVALTDNPAYAKLKVGRMRPDRERRQKLASCWRDTALVGKDLAKLAERVEEARRTRKLVENTEEACRGAACLLPLRAEASSAPTRSPWRAEASSAPTCFCGTGRRPRRARA